MRRATFFVILVGLAAFVAWRAGLLERWTSGTSDVRGGDSADRPVLRPPDGSAAGEAVASAGPVSAWGQVVDEDGAPLAGVEVVARVRRRGADVETTSFGALFAPGADKEPVAAREVTRPDGRFRLVALDPTLRYLVEARPGEGYAHAFVEPDGYPPYPHGLTLLARRGHPLALRVVDAAGRGTPALVSARSRTTLLATETPTDAEGRLALTSLPAGLAWLHVRVRGRSLRTFEVEVPVEGPLSLPIATDGGASVTGRVTTPGGQPLAGATVVATVQPAAPHEVEARAAARTAQDGSYRIVHLPPGSLQEVVAFAPGHLRGRHGAGGRALSAGDESRADLTLTPAFSIEARTLDESGAPLAGVRVVATTRESVSEQRSEASSDAEGRVRLGPFPPGPVRVVAHLEGWFPVFDNAPTVAEWTVQAEPAEGSPDPRPVPPAKDGTADPAESPAPHLDFLFRRALPVEGSTVDSAGQPVPHATVVATPAVSNDGTAPVWWPSDVRFAAVADEGGRFRFPGLAPGVPWTFEAFGPGRFGRSPTLGPWTSAAAPAPLTITLQPTASVHGRVVDAQGDPVGGRPVQVRGARAEAFSARDGTFSVAGLAAGVHEVVALSPSGEDLGPRVSVTLEPGERREGIVLRVPTMHRLKGLLVSQAGEPMPGLMLEVCPLERDTGCTALTRTDGSGRFRLDVWGEGPFRVLAGGLELDVPLRPAPEEFRLVHPGALTPLTVRVLDPEGRPVPKVRIDVVRQTPMDHVTLPKEVDGGILELPPLARAPKLRLDVHDPRDGAGRPLNLRGASQAVEPEVREAVIVLEAGRRIEGVVVGEVVAGKGDEPIPDLRVEARGKGGDGRVPEQRTAATDAEGKFAMDVAPPGDVVLTVSAPEPWLPAAPTELDGRTNEARLRLERGKDFQVDVVGPEKQALSSVEVRVRGIWNERPYVRRTKTNARGRALLAVAPTGSFDVEVEPGVGSGAAYPAVRIGDVTLRASPLLVRLEAGVFVEGEVFDPEGQPSTTGRVVAESAEGKEVARVRLGESSNRFSLGPVARGRYRVQAAGEGRWLDSLPVEAEAPSRGIRLTLGRPVDVAGRILDAVGRSLVVQWSDAGNYWTGSVAKDGTFRVEGVRDGPGSLHVFEPRGDAVALLESVTPAQGPFEVRVSAGARITGRVETKEGSASAGAWVHAKRGGVSAGTLVAEDGTFTIRGVPPGTWRLEVWDEERKVAERDQVAAGATDVVLRAE